MSSQELTFEKISYMYTYTCMCVSVGGWLCARECACVSACVFGGGKRVQKLDIVRLVERVFGHFFSHLQVFFFLEGC